MFNDSISANKETRGNHDDDTRFADTGRYDNVAPSTQRLILEASVKFAMFARHKSTLGSNFLLCVSRFGFSMSAFLNGSININYVIRHHSLSVTDNNHFYVAQFMRESIVTRDTVGRHGCSNLLSRSEISCIIQYLALATY